MMLVLFSGAVGLLVGLLIRTRFAAVSLVLPLASYALYYHGTLGVDNVPWILDTCLGLNLGEITALLLAMFGMRRTELRRSAAWPVVLLAGVYLSSITMSIAVVSGRTYLITATFMVSGILCAITAEARHVRKAGIAVIALSAVSTLVSIVSSDVWLRDSLFPAQLSIISVAQLQTERRFGYFPSLSHDGAFLSLATAVACLFCIIEWRRRRVFRRFRAVIPLLFALFVFVLYASLSQFRYLLLCALCSMIVILMALVRMNQRLILASVALVAGLFAAFGSSLADDLDISYLSRKSLVSFVSREEINKNSLQLFLESPVIGHGILSNGPMFIRRWPSFSTVFIGGSHNAHFVILTELGVIGFALWLFVIGQRLHVGYRMSFQTTEQYQGKDVNQVVVLLMASIVVAQLFHSYLYPPLLWFTLAWPYKAGREADPLPPQR
jgi:hypothetical protein